MRRLLELGSWAQDGRVPTPCGVLGLDHPCWWGRDERRLAAPLSLLEWLVRNVARDAVARSGDRGDTRAKRDALANRDPEVVDAALLHLRKGDRGRKWFVLEGHSAPDAFLETGELVFVVEGKRTEHSTTTTTKWMEKRSQLIRHMDAATEVAMGRPVLGLLLVEGDPTDPMAVPASWVEACAADVEPVLLNDSLPHRSHAERQALADGVLGAATWQRVCHEFAIPWPPGQAERSET
ncbi:MAG: hypothetical protein Q8P50_13210 [Bacillota bacterium]|nr:hypothetical protein [Bacillota bacterium]